jgi:hypothetical protein
MNKYFSKVKTALVTGCTTVGAVLASGVAYADGTVAAMVTAMPAIDLSILTSSGTKVFACIAVAVAIGIGIRMFKKA